MLPRDHFFPDIYTSITKACVKCCVAAVKKVASYYTSVLLYLSGRSGSMSLALLSSENLGPLKPVLGGVRDVALIHFSSCTDSIKLSLQFLYNFAVFNASEG
jgi:hypothetical protein